ncbi:MAG: hypothetical protein RIR18_1517 [Pseudomonadota bacterium]
MICPQSVINTWIDNHINIANEEKVPFAFMADLTHKNIQPAENVPIGITDLVEYSPAYEEDDGPLSPDDIEYIKETLALLLPKGKVISKKSLFPAKPSHFNKAKSAKK